MRRLLCFGLPIQLLLLVPVLCHSDSGGEADWSVTVKPFRAEVSEGEELAYWVGLTNKDVTSRAVCVAWVTYELDSADGDSVGGGVRGRLGELSPHPCNRKEDWHLVLPGQTAYRLVFIPTRQTRGECRVRIRVDLAEVCVRAEDCGFGQSLAETTKASASTSCSVRGGKP